jgi:hypothetical protein
MNRNVSFEVMPRIPHVSYRIRPATARIVIGFIVTVCVSVCYARREAAEFTEDDTLSSEDRRELEEKYSDPNTFAEKELRDVRRIKAGRFGTLPPVWVDASLGFARGLDIGAQFGLSVSPWIGHVAGIRFSTFREIQLCSYPVCPPPDYYTDLSLLYGLHYCIGRFALRAHTGLGVAYSGEFTKKTSHERVAPNVPILAGVLFEPTRSFGFGPVLLVNLNGRQRVVSGALLMEIGELDRP